MEISRFQFSDPRLVHIEFSTNSDYHREQGEQIELGIEINTSINKNEKERTALVELSIILGTQDSPFMVNAVEAALFRWQEDEDKVDVLLSQNAPALLLSYLRPVIANVTAASEYPSYNIPYVNFTK